jgi:hypothetical protein
MHCSLNRLWGSLGQMPLRPTTLGASHCLEDFKNARLPEGQLWLGRQSCSTKHSVKTPYAIATPPPLGQVCALRSWWYPASQSPVLGTLAEAPQYTPPIPSQSLQGTHFPRPSCRCPIRWGQVLSLGCNCPPQSEEWDPWELAEPGEKISQAPVLCQGARAVTLRLVRKQFPKSDTHLKLWVRGSNLETREQCNSLILAGFGG